MDHDHSMHNHAHHGHVMTTMPSISDSATTVMDHSMHDHSAHDHSAHAGHGSDSPAEQMVHHMMQMAFHGGCTETILFEQWAIDSVSGLLFSMLVIFIMAVCYEGLKYYREHLFWRTYNGLQYRPVTVNDKNVNGNGNGTNMTSSPSSNPEEGGSNRVVHMVGEVIHKQPPSMFSCMHFYQSLLHLVQVTLSFLLMLIFMTYNTYLCIAVVVGAAVGYFLFGWKKSVIVDVTEHCH